MHDRHPFQLPLLAVVCVCALAGSASAQSVTRFEVSPSAFSPNGDTRNESTLVSYAIDDTLEVSLVVFAADSVTPVDTLRAPGVDAAPGPTRTFSWDGSRWDGGFAGEGAYVVTLRATPQTGADIVRHLPLFIDVTPPTLQILGVTPDPYAPGLSVARPALEVSVTVGDASPLPPGRAPDRLGATVTDPTGNKVDAVVFTTEPPFAGASGGYILVWDATAQASSLAGGEYIATVTMDDAAGFTVQATHHFVIDASSPSLTITDPAGTLVRVAPDSLRGNAYDTNGIDSLYVKFPNSVFRPLSNTRVENDSLRFSVFVADSIPTEGTYAFRFRAVDGAGRSHITDYTLTYDGTAPGAPVLDAFSGAWNAPSFPLTGDAGAANGAGTLVIIERNDSAVDSIPLPGGGRFTADVPLHPGDNRLRAYLKDGAGNRGAPSNVVTVAFDSGAGVFFPIPFGPGGNFQVNLARDARSVTLRVFDVAGNIVTIAAENTSGRFHTFPWNGRNSSDHAVKRGPLVVTAVVDYDDGTRDVFREVFLFDPDSK